MSAEEKDSSEDRLVGYTKLIKNLSNTGNIYEESD